MQTETNTSAFPGPPTDMAARDQAPSPAGSATVATPPQLWDVKACAKFLGKSPRWLWSVLVKRPGEEGSVPHIRVGCTPRFFPEDIAAWVRQGCPPAATFAEWRAAEEKRQKRHITP